MNILFIDDEPDFLETTLKRLARRGYAAKSALDCDEALKILDSSWPDAVVLDVMLPGKDGIQCLREIKQNWPAMIVILLTGHASMEAGQKGLEYGASDYCLKPIELDELIEKIIVASKEAPGEPARIYSKILVAFDGTISTEFTLRAACRIARRHDSHVLVVVPFFTGESGGDQEDDITRGMKVIARQENVAMDVLFQDGRPSDTIIDVSYKKENDLIVMGKAEMSALEKFVIGSITGRIIGYANCDVIVIPEGGMLRWKRILLCADGTPYSHAAVNNAIAYARHFKGEINAVHVVSQTGEDKITTPDGISEKFANASQVLDEIAGKAKESDVAFHPFVREGGAARKILEVAAETRADVIIMGSHERVRIASLLLGSVARKVAMNADCPVFIIKP